ncbi:MAG: epoxyqueuosine reductase QueH [Chloroflexi bacterium]|nr:epoxyqueuosine reductase QueH [Chloroflexota bacterium]
MVANVLIHICCAPCATYTVEHWRAQKLEVAGLSFNPNIHPYTEHRQRLESLKTFAGSVDMPLFIPPGYDMVGFLRRVVGKEGNRCIECFRMRLSEAAVQAKDKGFDAFTTTLLISPHQKHSLLKEVGEAVGEEHGVRFLYADLRQGFSESRRMSKELGLYRQQYCGCIYSEWERYARLTIPADDSCLPPDK